MRKFFGSWIKVVSAAIILAFPISYAMSDYTVTQGVGTTIFAFTCFTTKVCPASVQVNSAGTEILTSTNPGVVNITSAVGVSQGSTSSGQTMSPIGLRTLSTRPTDTTAQTNMPVMNIKGETLIESSNLPYASQATPYTASASGTTSATTATLAGASSVTTYICGFSVRSNATSAATSSVVLTGVITSTMNFTHWTAPAASGMGITEMIFQPCVPASAANTSIAVQSPAPGTGGSVTVNSWGFKL